MLFIGTLGVREDLASCSRKDPRLRISMSLDPHLGPAINLGSCDFGQDINFSGPQFPWM